MPHKILGFGAEGALEYGSLLPLSIGGRRVIHTERVFLGRANGFLIFKQCSYPRRKQASALQSALRAHTMRHYLCRDV